MPGRQRLQEILTESIANLGTEAVQIGHAGRFPESLTEGYIDEHAGHAHAAIDRAAEAARILVRESS
jgi:hypothetical protein